MLDPQTDRRRLTRRSTFLVSAAALLLLLPLASLRLPAEEKAGRFSGNVYQADGSTIPNCTLLMINVKTGVRQMTVSDRAGSFRFVALPAGEYELRGLKPGFALFEKPKVFLQAGYDSAETVTLRASSDGDFTVTSDSPRLPARIRVGTSVQSSNLLRKVIPVYPANAKSSGTQGNVVLGAVISAEGIPSELRVINGHIDPELALAAVEAVSQWRYKPTLLNGSPVEVATEITVHFTLAP